MTTTTLSRVAEAPSSKWVAAHWETGFVMLGLFLSMAAIVPLIFDPAAIPGNESDAADPISQPAWLLVGLLFLIAAARVVPQMATAALRNLPIVALCYLALVSSLWSVLPDSTFKHAIYMCFGAAFGMYIGVRFRVEGLVRILSWMTAVILVLSVLFALAAPEFGLDAYRDNSWRGVFGTKNELGRIMLLGAVVWAVRGFAREISPTRTVVFVSGFAAAGLMSVSRTAMGVGPMLVGVGVLIWVLSRRESAWVPIKGLLVCGIVLAGLACVVNVQLLLAVVGSDDDLTGREGIWEAVFVSISERPWLGYGYDAFWRGLDGPSAEVLRSTQTITPHSHNGFLDILLSLGAVGLVLYLVALGTVLWRSVGNLHHETGTARTFPLIFCSFVVLYNLTESGLLGGRSFQWIIFAAVAAAVVREVEPARTELDERLSAAARP